MIPVRTELSTQNEACYIDVADLPRVKVPQNVDLSRI